MNRVIITGVISSADESSDKLQLLYKFKIDNQKGYIPIKFVFYQIESLIKIKENIEENVPLLIIESLVLERKTEILVERFYYLETLYDKLMNTFLDEDELNQVINDIETDKFDIINELNSIEE